MKKLFFLLVILISFSCRNKDEDEATKSLIKEMFAPLPCDETSIVFGNALPPSIDGYIEEAQVVFKNCSFEKTASKISKLDFLINCRYILSDNSKTLKVPNFFVGSYDAKEENYCISLSCDYSYALSGSRVFKKEDAREIFEAFLASSGFETNLEKLSGFYYCRK